MSNQKRLKIFNWWRWLFKKKFQMVSAYYAFWKNGEVVKLFGKNIIEKKVNTKSNRKTKAYVYSSLYGNRTLDKIEIICYAQAYLCSVGGKKCSTIWIWKKKRFWKTIWKFCSLLDVSKLVDGIDDIQQKILKEVHYHILKMVE